MPATDEPGLDVEVRQKQLLDLQQNLNILYERQAKYGGNVPLELLHQVADHRQAITLIEQALNGRLSLAELEESLKPLLLAIRQGQVINITAETYVAGDQVAPGAVVARGQGARATVFTLNVRDIRWLPVVIALIAIIGLMAYLYLELRPKRPDKMQGQFNVAVAEFLVLDENGNPVRSEDGQALANYLSQQLRTNFEELELKKALYWDVWEPDQTGPIPGQTRAEREQAAAAKATEINAHILIYGVITDRGENSRFEPEFFVNHASFEAANEISGQHKLGTAIRLALPFSKQIQPVENPALAGRVKALSLITLGLAYFSIDDYQEALPYFQQAANETRWIDTAGKEVVYLLLGNAYGQQVSREKAPAYLPQASAAYNQALAINSNYGRAKLGLAGVMFLLAQGDPAQLALDPAKAVDPVKLDEAAQLLEEAARLPDQPESANIETKAHYQRGQIALVRYIAGHSGGDWLAAAQAEFAEVTRHFESGDTRVKVLAAHAYARLGIIAGQQKQPNQAIDYLKKATQTASPFYAGEYYSWLANFYVENNQVELAREALEQAIAFAEARGDPERVKQYSDKLKALSAN